MLRKLYKRWPLISIPRTDGHKGTNISFVGISIHRFLRFVSLNRVPWALVSFDKDFFAYDLIVAIHSFTSLCFIKVICSIIFAYGHENKWD